MIQPLEILYEVRGYDCGYGGPLTPFALANYFQEAAGAHAMALGIGMQDMWEKGLTWMLSRIDIHIEKMPKAEQKVIARTWPIGTKKLFAQRCIELVDESGFKYAGAMYEYIIVDMKTRRVMRPERTLALDLTTSHPWPFPDLSAGIEDNSFETLEGFSPTFAIEARSRHIDHNGHVNNAHFINWLCDAVPRSAHAAICRIKVDFVHEILINQKVQVWAKPMPGLVPRDPPSTMWLSALVCDNLLAARGLISMRDLSTGK